MYKEALGCTREGQIRGKKSEEKGRRKWMRERKEQGRLSLSTDGDKCAMVNFEVE